MIRESVIIIIMFAGVFAKRLLPFEERKDFFLFLVALLSSLLNDVLKEEVRK